MGRGLEERGGDYIWSELVALAVVVVDLVTKDEDGGRSHSEETNGAVKAGGVEGVGKQLWW
jgi:hypothetical protein